MIFSKKSKKKSLYINKEMSLVKVVKEHYPSSSLPYWVDKDGFYDSKVRELALALKEYNESDDKESDFNFYVSNSFLFPLLSSKVGMRDWMHDVRDEMEFKIPSKLLEGETPIEVRRVAKSKPRSKTSAKVGKAKSKTKSSSSTKKSETKSSSTKSSSTKSSSTKSSSTKSSSTKKLKKSPKKTSKKSGCSDYKVTELKAMAKEGGHSGYSKMKKAELCKLLKLK